MKEHSSALFQFHLYVVPLRLYAEVCDFNEMMPPLKGKFHLFTTQILDLVGQRAYFGHLLRKLAFQNILSTEFQPTIQST